MLAPFRPARREGYQPRLAWFAAACAAWVFVLVTLGAFTTSIGAGMVFRDWPLSDGSLDPDGWLSNLAMFSEHSHRLSAGLMGAVTLALAVWIWRSESRRWLRRLGWAAVALVFAQAVVGGLRVLLDRYPIAAIDTNVGHLFAMLHACLAQVFVCTLLGIAAALSRPWIEARADVQPEAGHRARRLGILACGLLLAQLAIAAVMRHSFAGLAIPTFPLTPDGGLIPSDWSFAVGINFAHRAMALAVAVAIASLSASVWRLRVAPLRALTVVMGALLIGQIALGAMIVWTGRNPYAATAHVVVGACLSAATFLLTWTIHRHTIESPQAPAEARPEQNPAMRNSAVHA